MSQQNDSDLISKTIDALQWEEELFGAYTLKSTPDFSNMDDASLNQKKEQVVEKNKKEIDPIAACTNLVELYQFCLSYDALKTDLPGTKLVFGSGDPQADLVIIGEAPGEQENIEGQPFVGAAGQLLTKILAAIDLDRNQVYITNIIKHRPPNNRDPLPEEIKRSLPVLKKQIELIKPKLILCLGRHAAVTLLGKEKTLKEMRSNFYRFMDCEFMVTYHPSALLRNPSWKRPTWEDVIKLKARYDRLVKPQ